MKPFNPQKKRFLPSTFALVAGLLLLFPLLFSSVSFAVPPKMLEIHFLNIGQGDGILIRTPSGKNVLIDVGPPGAGRRIIGPYMQKLGIKQVNLLLISHPHLDHYGGWKGIVRKFRVKTFIDPGFPSRNRTYKKMIRGLRRKSIRAFTVKKHQILDLGGGVRLRILWPGKRYLHHTRSDANSNSIVARLEYKKFRVLLTGDAEKITEKYLLRDTKHLPSHVLKVAHHGSKHSTSKHFLRAVQPKIAIISCSKHNVYHHPHPKTIKRLRLSGIPTFITAWHGHVIVRSDGHRMWVSTKGRGKSEAKQSFTLGKLTPIKASTHALGRGHHPLHVKPEKKGWINIRRHGKNNYRSGKINPSKRGYIASRRSKVFHRRTCRFSRLIHKRNRVYYKTRRQALRSGRRPASDCKP